MALKSGKMKKAKLLWCLLIGATALACLPTDVTHHAKAAHKAPARHPGPAASSATIELLVILSAGASPRETSQSRSATAACPTRRLQPRLATPSLAGSPIRT